MLTNNFLSDMQTNLANMQTLQKQMTTGHVINKPSDDPFKAARAMQLTTSINTNKQYNDNIKDVSSTLDTTDTALGQVGDVLTRVRDLLVSSGNAAYGSDEFKSIKSEINEKVGQLSQVLNTSFDGTYIFGGTRGTAKPAMTALDANTGNTIIQYADRTGTAAAPAADIAMINSRVSTEISQGVSIQYNVTTGDIFNFNGKDLRTVLNTIVNNLDGKDIAGAASGTAKTDLSGQDLTDISDAITNVLKLRSDVGAKSNRMESALNKNVDESSNMTELLSKTEDIDITEKTMEYATMQTVYTASLQTSAKVIQPTLLDYLR